MRMTRQSEVRIGIVGLGRLGQAHAINLNNKTQRCQLVASCSISQAEIAWANEHLNTERNYDSLDKLIRHPNLDAIFIVSSTAMHAEHISRALEANLHVFCEKPIALDLPTSKKLVDLAKQKPHLVCSIGFMRRFDPSLTNLYEQIHQGTIGKPFMYHCHSADSYDTAEFQIQFSATSGGIFLDMCIHDIDLLRWLSGREITKVTAHGGAYCHEQFAQFDDADNIAVLANMSDGSIGLLGASRDSFNGYESYVTVQGTKGMLKTTKNPPSNHLNIVDKHGYRRPTMTSFHSRFEMAFEIEAQEFIDDILLNRQPKVSLTDALKATQVAIACQQSFVTGESVKLEYT